MKIGFMYYNFYPVTGGASVHGYHLAKELTNLGHTLYKINGAPDPYTKKLNHPAGGLIRILRECDLIYVRMDYFWKPRNLVTLLSLAAGKKVVVELNTPSDELALFGKNRKQIRRADRRMSWILKQTDGVIVVSEPLREYCETQLGLSKVYLVENGGEIYRPDLSAVTPEVRKRVEEIRKNYSRLIVWSGSVNGMQNFDLITDVAKAHSANAALLLIVQQKDNIPEPLLDAENIFLFPNPSRADLGFLITSAGIGLAFYEEYSWSRWGFYNSSLKVFEYLNNGLLTLCNKPGTDIQRSYPNYKYVRNREEIDALINGFRERYAPQTIRTWRDVAVETSDIIREVATREI